MNAELDFEFRVFYNEAGTISGGEMCHVDKSESNKYLVVTRDEYYNLVNFHVVNNKLELVRKLDPIGFWLAKNENGRFKVVKNNAPLLIEENEECSNIEYYDIRNN